jgi:tetratricopeptide (TPR) repeat protein
MTLTRPNLLKLLVPLVVFAATLFALKLIDGSRDGGPAAGAGVSGVGARSTGGQIRSLEAIVSAGTSRPAPYVALGDAFLQKVRESGDPSFYSRAETAFAQGLRRNPREAGAHTGMGALALARHDFRAGLRYGMKAHAEAPEVVRPYGVIVDAQVELGRYGEAERTLQRMVDLKPNLASYARVSYFRELHGDLEGALAAMRLAVAAGGDAPENLAYVQTLLGNLQFERGRLGASESAYRLALARFPGYPAAEAGLARVETVRGDLGNAIERYRALVARLPLPEHVIALAETELAAGRTRTASRDFALVRVEERLLRRNGVNTDTDLALFEANHGSPARAVALARRGWAKAPSVRSADALGWALTSAGRPGAGLRWAHKALKLGSVDPSFLYHAGMSARAASRAGLARRWLARSLARNPGFSPLYAPRARRALEALR